MRPKIYVYDSYQSWIHGIQRACAERWWDFQELTLGDNIPPDGFAFIRPSMKPKILESEKRWLEPLMLDAGTRWITDPAQILLYEDKVSQARYGRISRFMPETHVFRDLNSALEWIKAREEWPIVSKAAVGASSQFVRIHDTPETVEKEAKHIFNGGLPLNTKSWPVQEGYQLLQKFLPENDFTWRVNVIGKQFAVFKRYNHPCVPVAQFGNTDAVYKVDAEVASVLKFAEEVARYLKTKWCALDILKHEGEWYLLETSLAWPWPGKGGDNPFFLNGKPTNRCWQDMWITMLEQAEDGIFDGPEW